MKKINFYSGPAILPEEVMLQAQDGIRDFAGTGLSILEISHRSKEFVKVMDEAIALVKELMQLNSDREVMFLQGGGSSQFFMVPMNLLNEDETAAYIDTGQWAHNAIEEAKNFGKIHIAGSSREGGYTHVPKNLDFPLSTKYLHLTTNNTVYGTQLMTDYLTALPSSIPLVADMSSDIFSRKLDFNRFDLIYAGAQKNFGCAGTTLVVVNKNILGTTKRKTPKMLDYRVHIDKQSMHNTPSVFAVYVSYLTLKWIKKNGLKALEEKNIRNAKTLYDAIDASNLFEGMVAKEDRSLMNVCFKMKEKTLEDKFLAFTAEQNVVGIKGYRTVGGFRASIYNAMPERGVDVLVEAIKGFETAN
ncbi:MAG: 3-phosphoserine/phosphohydroxythreonine transaminase [Bacteroidota bacterium]